MKKTKKWSSRPETGSFSPVSLIRRSVFFIGNPLSTFHKAPAGERFHTDTIGPCGGQTFPCGKKESLMKRLLTLVLGIATAATLTGTALAEGFVLSDFGARGTALAGGMVGRADDASAVAWNPAGITQLPGTHTMVGFTMIQPSGTVDAKDGSGNKVSTDVDKHTWVNPHAYLTHQYNDRLWFGLGLFSRFGLGNSYPNDWPGRYNLEYISLQTISLNPNVAYKVNDKLSLAMGVEIMGANMLMKKDQMLPKDQGGHSVQNRLDGQSVALGINLAAHYKFNDQWAAGLTWRSGVSQHVKGKSKFKSDIPGLEAAISPKMNSDLHGNLHLPDQFSAGVTWRPTEDLSFEAGAVYTVWSRYRSLNIHLEDPMNRTVTSQKNWHDTWAFNLSAEYQALDWLTLRAGYIYETSCMDDSTADYMTPSNGRQRFTAGVGFQWDNWTLDLAYAYLIIKPLDYTQAAASMLNSGVRPGRSHNGSSHLAAMSLGYKF